MADTWITDMTHFLDQNGAIGVMPDPARKLAKYLASIVAAATNENYYDEDSAVVVHCRRRPRRKPCPGEIEAFIDPEKDVVLWRCPVCGDNGLIRNWQGTLWDCWDTKTLQ